MCIRDSHRARRSESAQAVASPQVTHSANPAAAREAFTLPLIFLTVTLFGGFRAADGQGMRFLPPPLIALILASLLFGVLVRAGAFSPERLLRSDRSPLENCSGAIVL